MHSAAHGAHSRPRGPPKRGCVWGGGLCGVVSDARSLPTNGRAPTGPRDALAPAPTPRSASCLARARGTRRRRRRRPRRIGCKTERTPAGPLASGHYGTGPSGGLAALRARPYGRKGTLRAARAFAAPAGAVMRRRPRCLHPPTPCASRTGTAYGNATPAAQPCGDRWVPHYRTLPVRSIRSALLRRSAAQQSGRQPPPPNVIVSATPASTA